MRARPYQLAGLRTMFRSISTVLSGTVLAQGLALLFLPVISRGFAPADFGAFQILASAIMLLMPFAAMKMEFAVLRVRSSTQLSDLLALCVLINLAAAAVIYLGVVLVVPQIAPGAAGALWATWMLPAGFLAAGLFQTLTYIPIRNKRYKMMAVSKVLQSGLFHAGAAVSGLLLAAPSPVLLVGWDIAARTLAACIIFADFLRHRSHRAWTISVRRMVRILRAYRRYPLYAVPSSFIGALAAAVPVFTLSYAHGADAAGQFGMAWRTGFMPLSMIIFAVAQVVSADLSRIVRDAGGGGRDMILKVVRNTVLFGVGPLFVIFVFGETIIAWVLGPQWGEAGRMLQAMVPLLLAVLIAGPVSMTLVITGATGMQFGWEVARATLLLTGLWASAAAGLSAVATVGVFSAVMLIMAIVFLGLALVRIDKRRRPVSKKAKCETPLPSEKA